MTADLSDFIQLTDDAAGTFLGVESARAAASRGRAAKQIASDVLALEPGRLLDLHEVSATQKKALDLLFSRFPRLISLTEGYLPGTDAVMAIVKFRLGSDIAANNLSLANRYCSELVNEVRAPRLRRFIRETLTDGGELRVLGEEQLIEFLTGPYEQFAKAASAGLVSRAGSLNEGLVREALKSEQVKALRTGTEGNADVQIAAPDLNPPQVLNVEIKSYGARERLLRGLQDCNTPKIGVGFFNKASEFNANRTSQLLGTNASAIYLPETTYQALDAATRQRQNAQGGVFYRPLNRLGSDMREFCRSGVRAFR